MGETMSDAVRAWSDAGRRIEVGGDEIFVAEADGSGTPVVVVHGYPGSSYDFAGVLPRLGAPAIAPDLLGYGLSAKPRTAAYSLFEQADLVAELVSRRGFEKVALVGHDMGTTVVSELVARANAGSLGFAVDQVFLSNGSIFIDLARLTRGQRFGLRFHGRALPFAMPTAFLRRNLRESIAPGTAVSAQAVEDLMDLIRLDGGDRLLTRQIGYIRERRQHQQRWTDALVSYEGPVTAIWGVLDPIAVTDMPRRLARLRPATEVVWLDGVGHWPSIEAPERLAEEIRSRLR